jgi:hypothetical protein
VGKVSALHKSLEDVGEDRWLVEISGFARINYPDLWDHGRNPVRYTSLEELGIRLDGAEFQAMPAKSTGNEAVSRSEPRPPVPAMLTIPEAKKALAATFGVEPEAVEITIRG